MRDYRKWKNNFGVVFAAPIFGGGGILTNATVMALKHAAEMYKKGLLHGVCVLGAYSDARKELVTEKMTQILLCNGVHDGSVVSIPYRKTSHPVEVLMEKFSIENEHEDSPRSLSVELKLIVPATISEYFCFKPINSKGVRISGYPEEVEIPFNLFGFVGNFLENSYYFLRSHHLQQT